MRIRIISFMGIIGESDCVIVSIFLLNLESKFRISYICEALFGWLIEFHFVINWGENNWMKGPRIPSKFLRIPWVPSEFHKIRLNFTEFDWIKFKFHKKTRWKSMNSELISKKQLVVISINYHPLAINYSGRKMVVKAVK